jgi:hypothetical protein
MRRIVSNGVRQGGSVKRLVLSAAAILITFWLGSGPTRAQVSAYGELSVVQAQAPTYGTILYGGTTGFLLDAFNRPRRVDLLVNAQGRFTHGTSFNLDGVAFGPRIELTTFKQLRPYGELLVGFARIHNSRDANPVSTDGQLQVNAGVSRRINSHLDWTVDYSYTKLYAYLGAYTPKTFSAGVIYHFTKR